MLPPSFRLLQEHNYAHYPGQASRHGDTSPGHSRVSYSGLIVQANTMGLITKIYLNQKTFVYKKPHHNKLTRKIVFLSYLAIPNTALPYIFPTSALRCVCAARAKRKRAEALYLFPFFYRKDVIAMCRFIHSRKLLPLLLPPWHVLHSIRIVAQRWCVDNWELDAFLLCMEVVVSCIPKFIVCMHGEF